MRANATVIDVIRRFNRFYTRRIGVLDRGLLATEFSLTEARVLYELAHRPGLTATDLIRELGIDAGYVSRMLGRFARRRLLARAASAQDGRRTHLRLSAGGRRAFAGLDRRSSAQVAALIAPLAASDRDRLAGVLADARRLLAGAGEAARRVVLRGPRPGELGWVVQRHGALYAAEYRWDDTFEALVARIVADYVDRRDPRRDQAWIAEMDGAAVGCVFLVRASATVGRLRLLLVEPSARGCGVGRQLVAACLAFARQAGYRKVTLWTNRVLHAARHLYQQAGFRLVKSEPHRSFGRSLVGETWEKDLAAVPSVRRRRIRPVV